MSDEFAAFACFYCPPFSIRKVQPDKRQQHVVYSIFDCVRPAQPVVIHAADYTISASP
jgi:hypothetical protein